MDRGGGAGGGRAWIGFDEPGGSKVAVFLCCCCGSCGCSVMDLVVFAAVCWGDWEFAPGISTVGLGGFPPSFSLASEELASEEVGFALFFPGHSFFALLRQLPMVAGLRPKRPQWTSRILHARRLSASRYIRKKKVSATPQAHLPVTAEGGGWAKKERKKRKRDRSRWYSRG